MAARIAPATIPRRSPFRLARALGILTPPPNEVLNDRHYFGNRIHANIAVTIGVTAAGSAPVAPPRRYGFASLAAAGG